MRFVDFGASKFDGAFPEGLKVVASLAFTVLVSSSQLTGWESEVRDDYSARAERIRTNGRCLAR